MRLRIALLLMALAPTGLAGQDRGLPELPREVDERVRDLRDDPQAVRMEGPARIASGDRIDGPLVVEGGSLELDGRVAGDVLVIGGDLDLGPGAAIEGDVLVVGGEIRGLEQAAVSGTLLAYGEAKGRGWDEDDDDGDWDKADGDWDEDEEDGDDDHRHRRHRHDDEGGMRLGLSIPGNYNRTEGLPVMFGPVIETAGANRLHIEAQAIWRTDGSESLEDEIGYRIRLQQGLFADRLRIGGDVRSMVRAIETRGLNSTEAGLAAVLFHSDLHDYYEEQSWAAGLSLHPERLPLTASLFYRQAEHGSLEGSDPWSLLRNDDAWRLQPVVAHGDVSTIAFDVTFDTRDDEDEPVRGYFATLGVEHALDQDLAMPAMDLDGIVSAGFSFDDFTVAHIDLRTYVPVNRSSTLNLRVFAGGSVDEAALPPQFQRALGGIGTLPGLSLFEGSCGSRESGVRLVTVDPSGANVLSDEALYPAYGCDRVALGQLEYRGGFAFGDRHRGRDEEDEHVWWEVSDMDLQADWAFFVDVARGWSHGNLTFTERGDTETLADVGIGVLFDEVGVYAAMPLTGDDHPLRVMVRLQRRF